MKNKSNIENFTETYPKLIKITKLILDEKRPYKTVKQLYITMAANKTSNLQEAITILDINGYFREAAQLVRSQMELQFQTQYLYSDKTGEEINKYLDYYDVYREKLYDNIETNDIEPNLSKIFKEILLGKEFTEAEIRKRAKNAQLRHKYSRNGWSEKSLYQMVKETDGLEFYRHYYFLYSEAIHSSVSNLQDYLSDNDKKQPGYYLLMTNTMVSFLASVLIIQQYCIEFNLPIFLKEVENLMTQVGLETERRI